MATSPSERPEQVTAQNRADTQPRFLSFPLNIGAHSILLVFNKYTFIPPGERDLNRLPGGGAQNRQGLIGPVPIGIDAIQLPMPANLQDTYSLRVQGNELGIGGAEVARAGAGVAGAGDIGVGALRDILGSALPDINWSDILNPSIDQASRNIAFLGRRAIDQALPGAARALDQGLGNTTNPKASLYFEGVNLKQFDFNWTLAPTESAESDRIRDISNTIRRHILPTYGTAVGLNKVLLNYPSTVDIFFLGVEDSYFFHYKTCMVQQFQTNYTPNGLAFVSGGKPAMVNMNMTLMEMDIHTSEDYGGASTENRSAGGVPPTIVTGEAS
jgi:hypothetical protein